jgi:hypothetical protein
MKKEDLSRARKIDAREEACMGTRKRFPLLTYEFADGERVAFRKLMEAAVWMPYEYDQFGSALNGWKTHWAKHGVGIGIFPRMLYRRLERNAARPIPSYESVRRYISGERPWPQWLFNLALEQLGSSREEFFGLSLPVSARPSLVDEITRLAKSGDLHLEATTALHRFRRLQREWDDARERGTDAMRLLLMSWVFGDVIASYLRARPPTSDAAVRLAMA